MLKKIAKSLHQKFWAMMKRGKGRSEHEKSLTDTVESHVVENLVESNPRNVSVAHDETEGVKKKSVRKKKPLWTLDKFVVPELEGKKRFHDFLIPSAVMQGIADLKFEYCTPIQEKSLTTVLAGKDIVGKANTGTGKTAVFLVGILSRLMQEENSSQGQRDPKALILAPTRELVIQIVKDANNIGRHTPLNVAAVYGGAEYGAQMDLLKRRQVDIIVATPGRLIDFCGKKVVRLGGCSVLVIDEADRMLDMGFIPDVRRIVGWTRKKEERQTLLFSATISEDVRRLSSQWCVDPELVEAESDQMTTDTVEQKVYLVTAEEKYHVLYNLISTNKDERIMIFANMKSETKKLADRLTRNGIECVLLSGDVPQNKRQARLESFRSGKVKVLVATDVAGRGIHIDGISYVVNYTLPYEPEDYVHRIGRTGRAGVPGKSVSFACEEGAFYLPSIEEYIGEKLECIVPEEELLVPAPKGTAMNQTSSKKPGSYQKRRPGAPRSKTGLSSGGIAKK